MGPFKLAALGAFAIMVTVVCFLFAADAALKWWGI
mgnify:CR=1 FL=1